MRTIRAIVQLVVDLPGILARKTEVVRDLLQSRAIFHHHMKTFERVRAVFFLEFPLEFIRWSNIKLVSPVRYGRGANV